MDHGRRPSPPSNPTATAAHPTQELNETPSPETLPVPKWLRREKIEWRRRVQNFTPSWFAVTMGTGIVSILLHQMPYNTHWLRVISIVIFILNAALFAAILVTSVLRYTLYPGLWGLMMRHPTQSLFTGTAPMGFATLVNMFVFVCVPLWGNGAVYAAWAMWWVDAVASMATCLFLPFYMMHIHPTVAMKSMTAAWLLPVVAPVVAAASGGIVAEVLPNPQHALWTVIVSYIMLGTSLPLAFAFLVLYLGRLFEAKLPAQGAIVSVFLPLGPFGQGGFAVMQLGKVALEVVPRTHSIPLTAAAGDFLYLMGVCMALFLWGFGLLWLFLAVASISRFRKIPFNVSWWALTFPLGVYAVATITLGQELPSAFLRVVGEILACCVILLWLVVFSFTVRMAVSGEMFHSPCLLEAQKEYEKRGADKEGITV